MTVSIRWDGYFVFMSAENPKDAAFKLKRKIQKVKNYEQAI